ncbi:MAG: murein biosynthesis integral membrane protein MurJ [Bacteroidetes bacterium]|nr:murein biosynthesis integral membrane protein MurJ [Bacteroidota bacterium]
MLKNILKIFTGTLFSRIFGFIREIIVAKFFGTGNIADAFTLALIFPNLFRQVLGEDMVERAFMPPFKTIYDQGNKANSWKYISVVFNWFFIALILVTAILYLVIPLFFSLKDSFPEIFGFIFKDQSFNYDLSLKLIMIILPFSIFIGVAAFIGSMLNFFEKNWIFGFAPAMLSVGVISGIYVLYPSIGGYSIAVGYVFGAFLQMCIQLPFIFNKKFKKETDRKYNGLKLKSTDHQFKTLKRESKLITLNALFDKTQEVFGRFFAATLIAGSTSSLFYAARLYQLPFAILSLPITRGINPELNKMKATKQYDLFSLTFYKGLRLYTLLFIPVTVILIICAPELVDLIFRRGKFDSNSLSLTTNAFSMYAIGLLPMSLVGYYKRVLSLFDKNKYALNISIVGAILNIAFAIILVRSTNLGHAGIALASSLAFSINMLVMGNYLKKELHEFVHKSSSIVINLIIILFVGICIIAGIKYFDLFFITNKTISFLSLSIKGISVLLIFSTIYFLNPKLRSILLSFFRK